MKHAVIDIGSNSMRLSVYETNNNTFRILFKTKIMAGLAGYVEEGSLSESGIRRAADGLLEFRSILDSLGIQHTSVFATASLRNIKNTDEAVRRIREVSGYTVQVISGEEEALLGYTGAMFDLHLTSGAFVDIGGASTEVVAFENGTPVRSASFPIGSLNLYRHCVKRILPGKSSREKLRTRVIEQIPEKNLFSFDRRSPLACVGGTARAVLKLAVHAFHLPENTKAVTVSQFRKLCSILYPCDRRALDLILKYEPDRIHTLIPGFMILERIVTLFGAEEIDVSSYGAREGYLARTVLNHSEDTGTVFLEAAQPSLAQDPDESGAEAAG